MNLKKLKKFFLKASSRDGAVKLWNCGTSSTIATVCSYSTPVNKMLLTKLPPKYESAPAGTLGNSDISYFADMLLCFALDPLEVDTADKLVLVGLDDGTVRGIHLGSKKEVYYYLEMRKKLNLTILLNSFFPQLLVKTLSHP